MYLHELEAMWRAEKARLMPALTTLPREAKVDWIDKSSTYRSGPDPYNSLYMGGMASHSLMHALGDASYRTSLADLLAKASDAQLDKGLEVCLPYIKAMKEEAHDA